jgi:hypothetical protein
MDVGAVPMNSVELQTWLREKEGNQPRGSSGSAQVVIWLKRSAASIRTTQQVKSLSV